jgi:hypothetical protein
VSLTGPRTKIQPNPVFRYIPVVDLAVTLSHGKEAHQIAAYPIAAGVNWFGIPRIYAKHKIVILLAMECAIVFILLLRLNHKFFH